MGVGVVIMGYQKSKSFVYGTESNISCSYYITEEKINT